MVNKKLLILGLVFLVIGAGLTVGSFVYRNKSQNKLKAYTHTTARVVRLDERREYDSDGYYEYLYAAVVEYEVDGITYTQTDNVYSSVRPNIGSRVEIAYDPYNPNNCVFVKSSRTGFVIMLVVGCMFTVFGLAVAIIGAKKRA